MTSTNHNRLLVRLFPALLAPAAVPALADELHLTKQSYDYSYQLYDEEDNRIRIESHYLKGNIEIDDDNSVRLQLLSDTISGSSPTGAIYGESGDFLTTLEDVRTGILGAIAHRFGDHRVELEISRNGEDDYISHGYALSDTLELNQKNTTVAFGVNYLDDTVITKLQGDQGKESYDVFGGVTQIIDKNTTVSVNLTLGYNSGYLNDPYKVIQRHEVESFPDGAGGTIEVPVLNTYAENRPDERFRQVLQVNALHFFEPANGALDTTARFSHDDFGVTSGTLQIEWRQALGKHLELTPFVRYYRQTAADFFATDLDNVIPPSETPQEYPDGSGTHYSADYRLSSFDAVSVGLKTKWKINDIVSATAAYERYEMNGQGSDTAADAAYITANIWTFGVNAEF